MGVDLERLKNTDDWLPALGTGDWAIVMPLGYPDLIVPQAWRQQWRRRVSAQFVRWVLAGEWREIHHDNDPSWDCSGALRRTRVDPQTLLTRYEMLAEWLDHTPVGDSRATFESGCGLSWPTYHDDFQDKIDRELCDLLDTVQSRDDEDKWEAFFDEACWPMPILADLLLSWVGQMSTAFVWDHLETPIRRRVAEEKRQKVRDRARWMRLNARLRLFWAQHFPDLLDVRFDMPLTTPPGSRRASRRCAPMPILPCWKRWPSARFQPPRLTACRMRFGAWHKAP